MILNIIIGFIIPWVLTIFIVKDRKILYLVAPFASTWSFTFNTIGLVYVWSLHPFSISYIAAIPYNLGLFSIYPCICIYLIKKSNINIYIGYGIASLIATFIESLGLLIGRVIYFNNWNIVATYIGYYISLIVPYCFYLLIKEKLNIL